MTDAEKIAAIVELLRKRVASGDVRAQVLREVMALANAAALAPEPVD